MAEIAGSAKIVLEADTSKLNKGLDEAESKTKSKLSGLASAAKTAGVVAAGAATAAATTAATTIAAVTKQSIDLYAEFEQNIGGVETLFGEAADTVIEDSKRAYEIAGVSASKYMEQATSFSASLIQSLEGDTAAAASYTKRAITDMADNANKMGTSLESIQHAYQGFAKGNFTMLDNLKLGYGGTKNEMARLVSDASKMTDEMERLGVTIEENNIDFANVVNAVSVIQEHLGITGTTATEAFETISGSYGMLKASVQDFTRGLSDPNADVGALFENMAKSAEQYGKNIGKTILRALPNIANAVSKLVSEVVKKLPSIMSEILPTLLDSVMQLSSDLLAQLPTITEGFVTLTTQVVIQVAQRLPELLKTLTTALMGIIQVLLQPENLTTIMNAGYQLLLGLVKAVPQIIQAFSEAFPTIVTGIIDLLTNPDTYKAVFAASKELLLALAAAVPTILVSLFTAFKNLFSSLWEKLKTIFKDFAASFGKSLANALIGAFNKVIGFLEDFINAPIRLINGIIDTLNAIPGVEISALSEITLGRIPELAKGGFANSATPAIIGEAGPEVVIPLERPGTWARAIATQLAAEFDAEGVSGGRTVNIYMTNEINNKLDIDEISQELVTSIRRAI